MGTMTREMTDMEVQMEVVRGELEGKRRQRRQTRAPPLASHIRELQLKG
jgi:hypothetical protein